MRVTVYGAGAIGGHLAGRLARGGATISVVARGAQLDAIRRAGGLSISSSAGDFFAPVAVASADPAEIGPQDAVIVGVKAPALASVAQKIAPLLDSETPVVFAMNGIPWWYFHGIDGRRVAQVDPDGMIWDAIGPARAIGCVVYSACEVTAPGVIRVVNPSSAFYLGEPDGPSSSRVRAIAAAIEAGGVKAEAVDDIRAAIWKKLLLNMMTGPICVLSACAQSEAFADPAVRRAGRAVLDEGVAIARALGVTFDFDAERSIANATGLPHKPSIVQDLLLGRPMEIAALYDAPLAMAREAGVETPTLDTLVALTRLRARQAGLYDG